MQHELDAVQQFKSDVSSLLGILDYEYGLGFDAAAKVPPQLTEAYRRALVRSRGLPAIRALTEWALGILGAKLPDEAGAQLYTAYEQLHGGSEDGAYDALTRATSATVLLTSYCDLSLTEAAAATCLVSASMDIADYMVAGMTCDLSIRCNVIEVSANVWALANGEGSIDGILGMLSRFFCLHDYKLGVPQDASIESIRSLLMPNHQNGDLPGFVIAMWAAEHGQLVTLNESITAAVTLKNAKYAMKRRFIEMELGLQ